jgi:ubiquitin-conjugating enzyme E2 Z
MANINIGSNKNNDVFISKDTMKRIISDVKELRKNPLTAHGIYYEHDDTDILKGKALIIGPRDTPYEDGFYLFNFKFSSDYPHSPPSVEFCTGDGSTRLNPNLYRSGKVCLSILNTWKGDQWSACQTLSSILLAICTVLNDKPLLNEPGVSETHCDFNNYTEIIRFKNIEVAILGMLNSEKVKTDFTLFLPIISNHFQREKKTLQRKVEELMKKYPTTTVINTRVYQLTVCINYKSLLDKIVNA